MNNTIGCARTELAKKWETVYRTPKICWDAIKWEALYAIVCLRRPSS